MSPNFPPFPPGERHNNKVRPTPIPFFSATRAHERFKRLPVPQKIFFWICSALILLSSLFGGVAYGVYAAKQPVKLPVGQTKTTLSTFFQQGKNAKSAPVKVIPKPEKGKPYWQDELISKEVQKPSSAPATMKAVSQTLSLVTSPVVTPTPQPSPTPQVTPTPTVSPTPELTPTPTPGKGKPTPTPTPTPQTEEATPTPTPEATASPEVTPSPAPTSTPEQQSTSGRVQPLFSNVLLAVSPTPEASPTPIVSPSQLVPASELRLVGTDANGPLVELVIPAGALDLSGAKTTQGTAPQGDLTMTLTQLHGHFAAESKMLGSFQFQLVDEEGQDVSGITLLQPATIIYHYQPTEMTEMSMDAGNLVMTWSPTATPETAAATATESTEETDGGSSAIPMTNDATALTLSAPITTLDTAVVALAIENPANLSPPTPLVGSSGGNTGQYGYSFPLTVAPGPPDTTPQLLLNYSSGGTNERHSPLAPAGPVGEGWGLSLGSISAEEYPNGTIWYSLSGVAGISDRLIPAPNGTDFETEHLSYLKIKKVTVNSQPCFRIWDTVGNFYELGCTTDSLQYNKLSDGTRENYRWDLNKVIPAKNVLDSDTNKRVMTINYIQQTDDINGHTYIRDAAPKQITYGNATVAGVVRFFYQGPEALTQGGVPWITDYSPAPGNVTLNCDPPGSITTHLRCDNPINHPDGLKKPQIMSTLVLKEIKTYVGNAASLYFSYALTHQDSPFYECRESTSDAKAYCAGHHLLTQITPTAYKAGVGQALPASVFSYSGELSNTYVDTSHTVAGDPYRVETKWKYLTAHMDFQTGVGSNIMYHRAYGNTHGTPALPDGDNRYDALFCTWSPNLCTAAPFSRPDEKQWSVQVVTSITNSGKDSSSGSLLPATTSFQYWLTHTSDDCDPDSNGLDDCVRYTWIPPSDNAWQSFYHAEFRGFGTVLITSSSGNLTVQNYATTEGWSTSQTASGNYTAGSLLQELIYQGGAMDDSKLLKKTRNYYAGNLLDTGVDTDDACNAGFTTSVYKPCAVMVIKRITTNFEQGGVSATAPTMTRTYTFDNYTNANGLGEHHQPPATGTYGNLLQEVIESSNAPIITKKWSYFTTNTTVSGTVFYNVRKVAHSELVDATGHTWLCQDTIYDEKIAPALPKPAAGWPTTGKAYSDCTNPAGTTRQSYTGYDPNGNVVATVDAVGAATPSLYTSNGCTLTTAPTFFPISSWSATRYSTCTKYDNAGVMPTDSWNVLGHHLATSYDATQGLRPVSVTDANNLVTTTNYNYDSSGNTTVTVKTPGEPGTYTGQASSKTTCTTASTLPCFEINNQVSLYPGAISRTFYDSQGRPVQSQTPGPGANQTTISFTVYNDQANSVFSSVPFVVSSRSTWLDPNGATDIDGVTPGGTMTTFDALGRTLTMTDPLGNLARVSYGLGSVSGDPKLYAKVTSVDANQHVTMGYTDALGRGRYSFSYSGVYGGTLTANTRVVTQYNALDLPISVTVTDLVPQGGQAVTEKVTTSQYDDQGVALSVTDPDRGMITYTTNANSQVIKEVRGSRVLGSSYDLLGRVGCLQEGEVTTSTPGACGGGTPLVEYTYDAYPASVGWSNTNTIGKLTQVVGSTYLADAGNTRGIVTENVQYNVRGLPIKQRMRIEVSGGTLTLPTLPVYELTQAYNNANQPTTTQTSVDGQAGLTSTNAYDSTTGVLVGLSNTTTGSPNLAELTYNARGLMADLIFKNSAGASLATTHLLYDGNLRPAESTTAWQSGGTIYTDGVGYDAIGNVMSKVSTHAQIGGSGGGNETQNYCYDELNRLKWAGNNAIPVAETGEHCGNAAVQETLGGAYTSRFAYTHLGHLWQGPLNGQGAQHQYLYCNPAKPHQVTHLSPTTGSPNCGDPGATVYTASYDAFGNLSTRTTNGEINTLTFDVFDQLTHWSTFGGGKQEWYLYSASGERVVRYSIDGSNKTLTVYAIGGDEHQYQIDASNNLINTKNTSYYALGGSLIGMLTTGSGGANPSTTFLLTDSLGSVVAHFSNEAVGAQVLGSQLYGPYGNERYQQGEIGTDRGFTGQYKDSLSGLNYYGARYYDPLIGRFLSEDAVAGGDPYAYVGGNPLVFTDPSGNLAMMPHPGGGGTSSPSPQPVCFNCGNQNNGYKPSYGAVTSGAIAASNGAVKAIKSNGGGGSNNSTNGKDKTDNGGSTQKGSGSHPNNAWNKAKEAIVKLARTGSPEAAAIVELGMDVIDLFFNFSGMANDIAILGDENASDGDKFWAAADLGLQILLNVASFTGAGAAGKIAQFASRMKGLGHVVKFADDAVKWGKGVWDNAAGWFGDAFKACGMSFSYETVVATSAGMVPIGNLQVGQQVWAYSETTGQMQLQPITHVWINLDDDLVDLTITTNVPSTDGKGETQTSEKIHTNKKHPFLTVEKGFLPVGELVLGMHVVRADGSVGTVSGWQVVAGSQKMYNLEVAQDHTFTVGDGQWVVHNHCGSGGSGLGFEDFGKLDQHFNKHNGEFSTPFADTDAYEQAALDFMTQPQHSTLHQGTRGGDTLRVDDATGWFGVMRGDGVLKTLFIPDPAKNGGFSPVDYFLKQINDLDW